MSDRLLQWAANKPSFLKTNYPKPTPAQPRAMTHLVFGPDPVNYKKQANLQQDDDLNDDDLPATCTFCARAWHRVDQCPVMEDVGSIDAALTLLQDAQEEESMDEQQDKVAELRSWRRVRIRQAHLKDYKHANDDARAQLLRRDQELIPSGASLLWPADAEELELKQALALREANRTDCEVPTEFTNLKLPPERSQVETDYQRSLAGMTPKWAWYPEPPQRPIHLATAKTAVAAGTATRVQTRLVEAYSAECAHWQSGLSFFLDLYAHERAEFCKRWDAIQAKHNRKTKYFERTFRKDISAPPNVRGAIMMFWSAFAPVRLDEYTERNFLLIGNTSWRPDIIPSNKKPRIRLDGSLVAHGDEYYLAFHPAWFKPDGTSEAHSNPNGDFYFYLLSTGDCERHRTKSPGTSTYHDIWRLGRDAMASMERAFHELHSRVQDMRDKKPWAVDFPMGKAQMLVQARNELREVGLSTRNLIETVGGFRRNYGALSAWVNYHEELSQLLQLKRRADRRGWRHIRAADMSLYQGKNYRGVLVDTQEVQMLYAQMNVPVFYLDVQSADHQPFGSMQNVVSCYVDKRSYVDEDSVPIFLARQHEPVMVPIQELPSRQPEPVEQQDSTGFTAPGADHDDDVGFGGDYEDGEVLAGQQDPADLGDPGMMVDDPLNASRLQPTSVAQALPSTGSQAQSGSASSLRGVKRVAEAFEFETELGKVEQPDVGTSARQTHKRIRWKTGHAGAPVPETDRATSQQPIPAENLGKRKRRKKSKAATGNYNAFVIDSFGTEPWFPTAFEASQAAADKVDTSADRAKHISQRKQFPVDVAKVRQEGYKMLVPPHTVLAGKGAALSLFCFRMVAVIPNQWAKIFKGFAHDMTEQKVNTNVTRDIAKQLGMLSLIDGPPEVEILEIDGEIELLKNLDSLKNHKPQHDWDSDDDDFAGSGFFFRDQAPPNVRSLAPENERVYSEPLGWRLKDRGAKRGLSDFLWYQQEDFDGEFIWFKQIGTPKQYNLSIGQDVWVSYELGANFLLDCYALPEEAMARDERMFAYTLKLCAQQERKEKAKTKECVRVWHYFDIDSPLRVPADLLGEIGYRTKAPARFHLSDDAKRRIMAHSVRVQEVALRDEISSQDVSMHGSSKALASSLVDLRGKQASGLSNVDRSTWSIRELIEEHLKSDQIELDGIVLPPWNAEAAASNTAAYRWLPDGHLTYLSWRVSEQHWRFAFEHLDRSWGGGSYVPRHDNPLVSPDQRTRLSALLDFFEIVNSWPCVEITKPADVTTNEAHSNLSRVKSTAAFAQTYYDYLCHVPPVLHVRPPTPPSLPTAKAH
ncbi:hypothetical protein BKA62DRAFT_776096 [Auriculariales sp. MPI-PUGE-AT-0066]|nr:hypothetical protein BKA62DRAFT_776096 [Auriculariales sp. MPI-PUGE-AT-0066]